MCEESLDWMVSASVSYCNEEREEGKLAIANSMLTLENRFYKFRLYVGEYSVELVLLFTLLCSTVL